MVPPKSGGHPWGTTGRGGPQQPVAECASGQFGGGGTGDLCAPLPAGALAVKGGTSALGVGVGGHMPPPMPSLCAVYAQAWVLETAILAVSSQVERAGT